MSLKSRVEAVLFLTDKPVVAAVVAKLVNADVQLVRQAILELIHDYEERNCALEIANDDDGYMMQVKDEYSNVANDLAPIDLPLAVVRTLSAIAIKQPVMQSDIVRIRGAGAYEHIKELLEKDLISKKEEGRSPLLSTTKKFQTYFRLSTDAKALRFQLKDKSPDEVALPEDQQLQIQDLPLDQNGHSEGSSIEVENANNDIAATETVATENTVAITAASETATTDVAAIDTATTETVATETADTETTAIDIASTDVEYTDTAHTAVANTDITAEEPESVIAPIQHTEKLRLDPLTDSPPNDDGPPMVENKFIASQIMN